MSWRPGYVALARSGELAGRVARLQDMLGACCACPRACGVDRRVEPGQCATGTEPIVASWTPHFGEEPVISGRRGSGTVFLANCNLRCAFCQNWQISQRPAANRDQVVGVDALAGIFLELQDRGCHNINWVSPTHQTPQLTAALAVAAGRGLELPVVYNTNAFDSLEVLRLLDGVVDIWMPDLKYADADTARELSGVESYPTHARAAIAEMFRQVGDRWELDPEGALRRGLLIRLLVLPNDLAGIEDSLRWIAECLSPRVGVSLMAQYYPTHRATSLEHFPLLARPISAGEWGRALDAAERWLEGDHHYIQEHQSAPAYYRPDFDDRETPFADIEDFR